MLAKIIITTIRKLEDKMIVVEATLRLVLKRLGVIEGQSTNLREVLTRLGELEDEYKGLSEVESRVGQCEAAELGMDERVKALDEKLGKIGDRTEACVLKLGEFEEAWPRPKTETFAKVAGKKAAKKPRIPDEAPKIAHSNRYSCLSTDDKDVSPEEAQPERPKVSCGTMLARTKDKVVVVGDSLSRGAGFKLRAQCGEHLVDVRSIGRARLEDIEKKIKLQDKKDNQHLVIIGGTNNLETDYTDDIVKGYEKILNTAIDKGNKSITVVGLMRRFDLGHEYDSKRIFINMKLKEKCDGLAVMYVEYEPERSRLHADGLHLNTLGQNELGKALFSSLKYFLV